MDYAREKSFKKKKVARKYDQEKKVLRIKSKE